MLWEKIQSTVSFRKERKNRRNCNKSQDYLGYFEEILTKRRKRKRMYDDYRLIYDMCIMNGSLIKELIPIVDHFLPTQAALFLVHFIYVDESFFECFLIIFLYTREKE
jgi:hypothetical protein